MKIIDIKFSTDILIKPVADRWYEIFHDFYIDYITDDCGRIRVSVEAGFLFDGRSGGPMVEVLGIAPNLGTQEELKCWVAHDLNAYSIYFTYDETNDILYQMLREIGYGWWRAKAIYTAVNYSDSWFGEPLPDEKEYPNLKKIHVRHYDK